jgi:hypothetical protein
MARPTDVLPTPGGADEAQDGGTAGVAARAGLQGRAHSFAQFVQVDGLGKVVHGPGLQGAHGRVHGGVAGDEDEPGIRGHVPGRLQELHAVHALHLQVRDDAVELLAPQQLQGLLAVGRDVHVVALAAEHVPQVRPGDGLVVDDQQRRLPPGLQHAGGQVFEHPLPDLSQPCVAAVEDLRRLPKVEIVLGQGVPRQGQNRLHIVQGDGVFPHGRVGLLHPPDLGLQHRPHALGHVGLPAFLPKPRRVLGRGRRLNFLLAKKHRSIPCLAPFRVPLLQSATALQIAAPPANRACYGFHVLGVVICNIAQNPAVLPLKITILISAC